jgi:hypothetical protein
MNELMFQTYGFDERIVTHDVLTRALVNSTKSISKEDKEKKADDAMHILNHFGYQDMTSDYLVDYDTKALFYILEDIGILSTKTEEEFTITEGIKPIPYWVLKKKHIFELAAMPEPIPQMQIIKHEAVPAEAEADVYSTLDDVVWRRNG